jgi:hypothetical protein
MLDLADVSILLLFIAAGAWLWRGHGIRERALALVRRHCEKTEIILLDDNVALQRLRWLPDARGQRRLARVYGFEFTVTGEQRHTGSISMFGQQLGKIELAAHPVSGNPLSDGTVIASFSRQAPRVTPGAEIIQLHDWRQAHPPAVANPPRESAAEPPTTPPPSLH